MLFCSFPFYKTQTTSVIFNLHNKTKQEKRRLKLFRSYSATKTKPIQEMKREADAPLLFCREPKRINRRHDTLPFYSIKLSERIKAQSFSSIPLRSTKQRNMNQSRRLLFHLHNEIEDVISSIVFHSILFYFQQTPLQPAFCCLL